MGIGVSSLMGVEKVGWGWGRERWVVRRGQMWDRPGWTRGFKAAGVQAVGAAQAGQGCAAEYVRGPAGAGR